MVNASGFQQRGESGSRSVHQFSAQAHISLRAGRGADEKLILQGLEVERSFTRLNMCLGFFKPTSSILLNCFHSSILDALMTLGKNRENPENPSCQHEIRIENTCLSCSLWTRWQLQIWDIQVRSMAKQSYLDNQQRARFCAQLGLSWSRALFEEALLFPLTTELVKDDHAQKLGTCIRYPEWSGIILVGSG